MGLVVSGEDVEELLNEISEETATEDLQDHLEVQQTAYEEVASDKGDQTDENVPSSWIKDMFSMWSKLQGFVQKNHPHKAAANRACSLLNDNVLPYFWKILKRQQKHFTLYSSFEL